jgi:TolB protein
MDADGSNSKLLTTTTADDYQPKWSPDGKIIIFQSNRDNASLPATGEIYGKNPDGTGAFRLTTDILNVQWADWAPDGGHLVYSAKPSDTSFFEVYVVNLDGTGIKQLTKTSANESYAAFSPDGKFIVFTSGRSGTNNLFMMSADASNEVQLTNSPADNIAPNWRPVH